MKLELPPLPPSSVLSKLRLLRGKQLPYLPWQGRRLSSSWLGRTGRPLGQASPREAAETDPSPHPLHCDWACKPVGEGGIMEGEAQAKGKQIKGEEKKDI